MEDKKQNNIILYTKDYCPYCVAAKKLLQSKNLEFKEIDVGADPALLAEMLEKSEQRRTVPQIIIGDRAIGGFDDMKALHDKGELDSIVYSS